MINLTHRLRTTTTIITITSIRVKVARGIGTRREGIGVDLVEGEVTSPIKETLMDSNISRRSQISTRVRLKDSGGQQQLAIKR